MKIRKGLAAGFALCLCGTVVPGWAQDNGAYRAGQALGGILFHKQENTVYNQTLMQGLELRNQMYEAQQNKAEADALEQLVRIRNGLAQQWEGFGLPRDQAVAVAQAFSPSESDGAVFLSVRGEPMPKIGDDIRSALSARNYQLANQLLLGALMEARRQQASAPAIPATVGSM